MKDNNKKTSKFLSLVLRHRPEAIGVNMTDDGWVNIDELIKKSAPRNLSKAHIEDVVRTNDKQRFKISEDGNFIRASQGHSIDVDMEFKPVTPPSILYHGTATKILDSILNQGLISKTRQYVHLSADIQTATKVGMRHGKVVILIVDTKAMNEAGRAFYLSDNDVWLTDTVPPEFLRIAK